MITDIVIRTDKIIYVVIYLGILTSIYQWLEP